MSPPSYHRSAIPFICGLLLVTASALATTPPPPPTNIPPLRTPSAPHLQPAPPAGAVVPVWTPQLINSMHLSSTVERDLLSHLGPSVSPTSCSEVTPTPGDAAVNRATGQRNLTVATNTTAGTTAQATSDTSQDIEPAIITDRFVEYGATVDRTTTAFTKFDANNAPSPLLDINDEFRQLHRLADWFTTHAASTS